MLEKNNREALQPILAWMREKVEASPRERLRRLAPTIRP